MFQILRTVFDVLIRIVRRRHRFIDPGSSAEEETTSKEQPSVTEAEMDQHLKGMWEAINQQFFGGELEALWAIDWGPISGPGTMEAFGRYIPQSKCIIIADRFQFDADKIRSGDKQEAAKAEIAYRLMLHEMIHQSLHQIKAPSPGQHREAFIAEAERIAVLLKVPPPLNEVDAARWPGIGGLMADYNI